jgi:2,4-dienoyl-CoA reductase-like NADH-dependent reductase (Old Yellow Enzyme family)
MPMIHSTPVSLRGKALRSRIYLPAHQPGLADDGRPGERYIAYHRMRAKAGLGMQITGATPVIWSEVWADGLTLVNVDDSIVPGYRALARAVHDEGGLMLAQLAHVGAMETAGDAIVSASWGMSELTQQMSREATPDELEAICQRYGEAAARCADGDLDGVEVTMAHGMLLASFLSPAMNRRTDGFGGDLEGRTLFPRQVLAAVRKALGEDRIVGLRLPGDELIPGGIDAAEAARLAARLCATGMIDYVSVTTGNNTQKMARVDHWPPTPAPFAAFRHLSRAVKATVAVPVATVGRVTTLELANEILASGDADLVGMVRAHVADPELLPKSSHGGQRRVRPCIGANVCINALLEHKPLSCMVNPDVGRPHVVRSRPTAARNVVVLGGGPAGLEAARRMAGDGHRVTLLERAPRLGGQMRLWADTASRREFLKTLDWWQSELQALQVRVVTGATSDLDTLLALRPDAVVVATGSVPLPAAVQGLGDPVPAYGPYDAPAAGGHVLVHDTVGRLPAMLTAERLVEGWERVTFVTSGVHPGEGEGLTTAYSMLRALGRLGVTVIDRARLVRLEGRTAVLAGVFDEPRGPVADLDAIVSLVGSVGVTDLALEQALRDHGIQVVRIGDARLPRGVTEAVRDAASLDDMLLSPSADAPPA